MIQPIPSMRYAKYVRIFPGFWTPTWAFFLELRIAWVRL